MKVKHCGILHHWRHYAILLGCSIYGCNECLLRLRIQGLLKPSEVWQAAPSLLGLPIRCRGTWRLPPLSSEQPARESISCHAVWRRFRFKMQAAFLRRCLRFLFRYISCITPLHSGYGPVEGVVLLEGIGKPVNTRENKRHCWGYQQITGDCFVLFTAALHDIYQNVSNRLIICLLS